MSQDLFNIKDVLAKIKFTLLHQKVKNEWPSVRKQAIKKGLHEEKSEVFKKELLKDKEFATLIDMSAATLSKNYHFGDWIFSYISELRAIDVATGKIATDMKKELWGKLSPKQRDLLVMGVVGSSNYKVKIDIVNGLLNYFLTWNPQLFDWQVPETNSRENQGSTWSLADYLQKDVKPEFTGKTWKMYMQQSLGVQKLIVRISEKTDEDGFYKIHILRQFTLATEIKHEDIEYEGVLLTDNKQDTKKVVGILKDSSSRYAHLILFTEDVPRNQRRTLSMGHFTYFANRPNVNKYLTKTVILTISDEEVNMYNRIVLSEELVEDEKLIFRYLSDRKQNRLSSTTDHLYSINGLKEWFNGRYPDAPADRQSTDSLRSFCGSFYVYFVKKHPLEADQTANELEFIKDILEISAGDNKKCLMAKFNHSGGPVSKPGVVYQGDLSLWKDLFHGHLISASSGPLYITFRTNKGIYQEGNECFVGLIAGERDGSNSAVSYTCVVVPAAVINAGQAEKKEQIIENYLKGEARQGWAVVDPSSGKSNKFKISALINKEDERKFEEDFKA